MLMRPKRCQHCKSQYSYQASGAGCGDPLNDDRYCPDCMAVINAALEKVPVKFKAEWLPVIKGWERIAMSVEEFDKLYQEHWNKVEENPYALHTYPIEFGIPDVEIKEVTAKGIEYRKYTDKITRDVIIMVRFETNQEGKVTDIW